MFPSHPVAAAAAAAVPTRRRRDAAAEQGYLDAAHEVDSRLDTVLSQLRYSLPRARASVEEDIASTNRDRAIIGLANLFGSLFGVASATHGDVELGSLKDSEKVQVVAEFLYGYGYWGPFLLQFEDARLDCGEYELVSSSDLFALWENASCLKLLVS